MTLHEDHGDELRCFQEAASLLSCDDPSTDATPAACPTDRCVIRTGDEGNPLDTDWGVPECVRFCSEGSPHYGITTCSESQHRTPDVTAVEVVDDVGEDPR